MFPIAQRTFPNSFLEFRSLQHKTKNVEEIGNIEIALVSLLKSSMDGKDLGLDSEIDWTL